MAMGERHQSSRRAGMVNGRKVTWVLRLIVKLSPEIGGLFMKLRILYAKDSHSERGDAISESQAADVDRKIVITQVSLRLDIKWDTSGLYTMAI